MKTDELLLPRSGALGHVAIMYNGQPGPDAEVHKPHHCQKSGQLPASGISNTYTANAIASRERLASIQAEGVSLLIVRQPPLKEDYLARIPPSRWKRVTRLSGLCSLTGCWTSCADLELHFLTSSGLKCAPLKRTVKSFWRVRF